MIIGSLSTVPVGTQAAQDPVPLASGPIPASAPVAMSEDRLHWDEGRPRFRPIEYATTAVVGTTAIVMYFVLPEQPRPHWIGGILFDDAVRNALRVSSPAALKTAWFFADAMDTTLVAVVFGLDSLTVPTLRGAPDVGLQLGLMDAEAYSFSSVVGIGLYDSVGRARPSYQDCQKDPSFVGCNISPTASFPSGHTVEAFTAAGVSCANHAYVPIYGSHLWDALACVRDTVFATSEGLLRIVGDRHYATDVLAGAAIGFGFGYGMPVLLHYAAPGSKSLSWMVTPAIGPDPGIALLGNF